MRSKKWVRWSSSAACKLLPSSTACKPARSSFRRRARSAQGNNCLRNTCTGRSCHSRNPRARSKPSGRCRRSACGSRGRRCMSRLVKPELRSASGRNTCDSQLRRRICNRVKSMRRCKRAKGRCGGRALSCKCRKVKLRGRGKWCSSRYRLRDRTTVFREGIARLNRRRRLSSPRGGTWGSKAGSLVSNVYSKRRRSCADCSSTGRWILSMG